MKPSYNLFPRDHRHPAGEKMNKENLRRQDAGAPRKVFFLFIALFIVVACVWILTPSSAPPLPTELSKDELEFRDDRVYRLDNGELFTGTMIEHHEDGVLKSSSVIAKGQLHGISKGWYANGQLQVEESFLEGVSHGCRVKWHANGEKQSEANIVNGVIEGTFRRWHDNGQQAQEIALKSGIPHGLSKAWHTDGTLKAEMHMENGKAKL